MPVTDLKPFPELPVEIVRGIFETSAVYDKTSAQSLTLVSHAVKQWIDPILYCAVALPSTRRFKAFNDTLRSVPDKLEITSRVRALHLPLDEGEAVNILLRCNKLEHLAINWVHLASKESEFAIARPKRLILFGHLASASHPIFSNVTHLSIFSIPLKLPIYPHLFPALTHLMGVYILDNPPPGSFVRSLRRTVRRIPRGFSDNEDMSLGPTLYLHPASGILHHFPPLKLMVLNICNAPARPDHDRVLEIWKFEEDLLKDNILMRPSERLTLSEWESEAMRGGVDDRWSRLEQQLEERKREYEQLNAIADLNCSLSDVNITVDWVGSTVAGEAATSGSGLEQGIKAPERAQTAPDGALGHDTSESGSESEELEPDAGHAGPSEGPSSSEAPATVTSYPLVSSCSHPYDRERSATVALTSRLIKQSLPPSASVPVL